MERLKHLEQIINQQNSMLQVISPLVCYFFISCSTLVENLLEIICPIKIAIVNQQNNMLKVISKIVTYFAIQKI